jgi:cobyric acid synthase
MVNATFPCGSAKLCLNGSSPYWRRVYVALEEDAMASTAIVVERGNEVVKEGKGSSDETGLRA